MEALFTLLSLSMVMAIAYAPTELFDLLACLPALQLFLGRAVAAFVLPHSFAITTHLDYRNGCSGRHITHCYNS